MVVGCGGLVWCEKVVYEVEVGVVDEGVVVMK